VHTSEILCCRLWDDGWIVRRKKKSFFFFCGLVPIGMAVVSRRVTTDGLDCSGNDGSIPNGTNRRSRRKLICLSHFLFAVALILLASLFLISKKSFRQALIHCVCLNGCGTARAPSVPFNEAIAPPRATVYQVFYVVVLREEFRRFFSVEEYHTKETGPEGKPRCSREGVCRMHLRRKKSSYKKSFGLLVPSFNTSIP
jgi:hypothetical protein